MSETTGYTRPCFMFVIGMTPTKIGGLEKWLRALAEAMNEAGWNTVYCLDGSISDEFRAYFNRPFITLDLVDHQSDLGFSAVGMLWQKLRLYRPQVFAYAFHSSMRIFPWIALFGGCKRIFFNDHSSRPFGMVPQPLSLPKRLLGRLLTHPLTAILSVADFTRRSNTAFGTTTAPNIVITNGIEMKAPDAALRAKFREARGLPQDAVVVVQVAWMVEVKGVDIMLAAAKRVLKTQPATRFLLVGGGAELASYIALSRTLGVDHAVQFTDIVSDPVGAGVFDAGDIYCQPSRWQEACPLAVLEAMSKRLPVVASRTGGLPELIAEGETGELVPVGDSEQLAASLLKLIGDPSLRSRMGEAAYQRVHERHTLAKMVGRYVDAFLDRRA